MSGLAQITGPCPPRQDCEIWDTDGTNPLRQAGGGVGLVDYVSSGGSGIQGEVLEFRDSIKETYDRRGEYDVATHGGSLMAHMAIAALSGDWASALFRTQLIRAIIYDNFGAYCDRHILV